MTKHPERLTAETKKKFLCLLNFLYFCKLFCSITMALNYLIKSKGLVLLLAILIMTFVSPDNAFGQSKRALLVGISNYPSVDDNSWDTINGTNDIHLIAKTLKNSGYSINELSNDEATFEAIRKALSSLASNCNIREPLFCFDVETPLRINWRTILLSIRAKTVLGSATIELLVLISS